MNELICQTEPRKAPLHYRRVGGLFGRSLDQKLTPSQVILSLSTEPVVLFQIKHARLGFPNEVPSGPVLIDRSGIAGGPPAKRPPNFGPDRVVYAYPARHYPTLKGLASEWQWAAGKALKGVEQSLALFWGR